MLDRTQPILYIRKTPSSSVEAHYNYDHQNPDNMIYATVRQFLLWAPYKNYFMYAWMYVFCCVQLLLIGTEYVLQCVRVTGHEIETFSTCVAGVVDFFTSIQMECGELSRDSHISALVLSIRTALSRLRSLA